jgi:hypothetical protein
VNPFLPPQLPLVLTFRGVVDPDVAGFATFDGVEGVAGGGTVEPHVPKAP